MAEAAEVAFKTVAEEAPIAVKIDAPAKPEGKSASGIDPTVAINDLKAEMERSREESKKRLLEKDRLVQEAAQRAMQAERRTVEVQHSAVATSINSMGQSKQSLLRDLKSAYETGKFEEVAQLQDQLSMLNTRLVEAERGKVALDAQVRQPAPQSRPQTRAAEDWAARVEQEGSFRSAAWLRAHPEVVESPGAEELLTTAHHYALGHGARVDSDEYFHYIEEKVGLRRAAAENRGRDMSISVEDRAPTAAPVSRSANPTTGRGSEAEIVYLTPGEASTALAMRLDPKQSDEDCYREYVRNKDALKKEGKM